MINQVLSPRTWRRHTQKPQSMFSSSQDPCIPSQYTRSSGIQCQGAWDYRGECDLEHFILQDYPTVLHLFPWDQEDFFFFLLFFFLSRGREFLKILSRNLNYFFSPDTLSGCTSLEILKDLFSKGETLKISKKMVKYNLFFFLSEEQWITKLSEFYSQESKETEVWLSGHKH